jgi:hypothetical protein
MVTWTDLALVALAIFGVARFLLGLATYFAGYMCPVPDGKLGRAGCLGVAIGAAALFAAIWGLAT